ncbi:DNA-directed RNA polymerase II subunit RPB1 [Hordeum vulgare]|nr:DNA-directed RNA polymerase II subunit RPB1 [Hordeum vulgare]
MENANAKIPQASSESSLHNKHKEAAVADAEMHADHAAAQAMEPLPHEISERDLEMRELYESNECLEELRLAQVEVEKFLSDKESVMEYQRELSQRHYYEYHNDEGDADSEDAAIVKFSLGDAESSSGEMSRGQVTNMSSKIGKA